MKKPSLITRRSDSLATTLLSLTVAALLLTVLAPVGTAWAGGYTNTVVLKPTGAVKARYLARVDRSLAKSVAKLDNVSMATKDGGEVTGDKAATCAVSVACLAQAGVALGGTRMVGVLVEAKRKGFKLTFVLIDVGAAAEILRVTEDVKHRKLRDAPGPLLASFLAGIIEDDGDPAAEPADELGAMADDDLGPPSTDGDLGLGAEPDPLAAPEAGSAEPVEAAPAPAPAPVPAPAPAAAPAPTAAASTSAVVSAKKLHVGLQAGGFFPQLQSELGTAPVVELEGGYVVWRNLAPYVSIGYAQPKVTAELDDPRLPAADYTTSTTQRELTMTVGALWRLFESGARFNAYGGLGARLWLLETITNGEAGGSSFLENRETSTRFGAAVIGGAEYAVGPGGAVFEVDLGGSNLPHLITGDVATTAISTSLGYRLMF